LGITRCYPQKKTKESDEDEVYSEQILAFLDLTKNLSLPAPKSLKQVLLFKAKLPSEVILTGFTGIGIALFPIPETWTALVPSATYSNVV